MDTGSFDYCSLSIDQKTFLSILYLSDAKGNKTDIIVKPYFESVKIRIGFTPKPGIFKFDSNRGISVSFHI